VTSRKTRLERRERAKQRRREDMAYWLAAARSSPDADRFFGIDSAATSPASAQDYDRDGNRIGPPRTGDLQKGLF
jgi:hypothetical protein